MAVHGARTTREATARRTKVAVCVLPPVDEEGSDFSSQSASARPISTPSSVRCLGNGVVVVSDDSTWNETEFTFDSVFGAAGSLRETHHGDTSTETTHDDSHSRVADIARHLFVDVGEPALDLVWAGHDVGVVCLGHSSSGTRQLMRGDGLLDTENNTDDEHGLLPKFCKSLFQKIEQEKQKGSPGETRVEVRMSSVRNDKARDLLAASQSGGMHPHHLHQSSVRVTSLHIMRKVLRDAFEKQEDAASESHVLCQIVMTRFFEKPPCKDSAATRGGALAAAHAAPVISTTTFVELMGLELRDEDASLADFVLAVETLADAGDAKSSPTKKSTPKKSPFETAHPPTIPTIDFDAVPVAEVKSTLTELLKHTVLGGCCANFVVATVTSVDGNVKNTLATLAFAKLFRKVVTHAKNNKDPDALKFIELTFETKRVTLEIETLVESLALARGRRGGTTTPTKPDWGSRPSSATQVQHKSPGKTPSGTEKTKNALAALRNRPRTPVKAGASEAGAQRTHRTHSSDADDPHEKEQDEILALRSALRDARAAMELVERARRNARTRWAAKLTLYAGNRGAAAAGAIAGIGNGTGGITSSRDTVGHSSVPGTSGVPSPGDSGRGVSVSGGHENSHPPAGTCRLTPLRRPNRFGLSDSNFNSEAEYQVIDAPDVGAARAVFIGTDRTMCDVVVSGFGVRPLHAVVFRNPDGTVTVTAFDDDQHADVWVNGARVASAKDSGAFGTKTRPLKAGDRVVIGAQSGVAYVFETSLGAGGVHLRDLPGGCGVDSVPVERSGNGAPAKHASKQSSTNSPWVEAQAELKPRAATLARALAGAPSSPIFEAGREGDANYFGGREDDANSFPSSQGDVARPGERRRVWRDACRRNIAEVLPFLDEANRTFKMLNLSCVVAPAWASFDETNVDGSGSNQGQAGVDDSERGAPVRVIVRNTKLLSERALRLLESFGIDDTSGNVCAVWDVFEFHNRLTKLRALRENGSFFEDPDLSKRGGAVSVECETDNPFLTRGLNGAATARLADGSVDTSYAKKEKAEARHDADADARLPLRDTLAISPGLRSADETREQDGSFSDTGSDYFSGSDASVGASSFASRRDARETRHTQSTQSTPQNNAATEPERFASGSETDAVQGLFRALTTERRTIATMEKRLAGADAQVKRLQRNLALAETENARRAETLAADLRAVRGLADERVAEAEAVFRCETERLTKVVTATKSECRKSLDDQARVHAEVTETAETKSRKVEQESKSLKEKIQHLEDQLGDFGKLEAKTHDYTPGVPPFSFPEIPSDLLKPIQGEHKESVCVRLRGILATVKRVSRGASTTLEYSASSLARVRTECAAARADKADEIVRRVAVEYAVAEKDETIAKLQESLKKVERTATAMAVANARAMTPTKAFVFEKNMDTFGERDKNPPPRGDDIEGDELITPQTSPRVAAVFVKNEPPVPTAHAANRSGTTKSPPDWAKSTVPLLDVARASLQGARSSISASASNHALSRDATLASLGRATPSSGSNRPELVLDFVRSANTARRDAIPVPPLFAELTDLAMSLPLSANRVPGVARASHNEQQRHYRRQPEPLQKEAQRDSPQRETDSSQRERDSSQRDSPQRDSPPPRGPVASRVAAKLGTRVRSAANSQTSTPNSREQERPFPPSVEVLNKQKAREWWETDFAGNSPTTPETATFETNDAEKLLSPSDARLAGNQNHVANGTSHVSPSKPGREFSRGNGAAAAPPALSQSAERRGGDDSTSPGTETTQHAWWPENAQSSVPKRRSPQERFRGRSREEPTFR